MNNLIIKKNENKYVVESHSSLSLRFANIHDFFNTNRLKNFLSRMHITFDRMNHSYYFKYSQTV